MRTVNVVVMGKTGVGKSTLINTVYGKEIAPTGSGKAVTKENKNYSTIVRIPNGDIEKGKWSLVPFNFNLYDTVGLEINDGISCKTVQDIKRHIIDSKLHSEPDDITIVWYCVDEQSNRFENNEYEIIKHISYDCEIPVLVVITQSVNEEKTDLERIISELLPGLTLIKVLASDFLFANEQKISSHSIEKLLSETTNNYDIQKREVLERKIKDLRVERIDLLESILSNGHACVNKYSEKAMSIGLLPAGCIPFVHGICIKMISELNVIAGIKGNKSSASDIFSNAILGVFATPFMAVPVVSAIIAKSYVETIGDNYLNDLISVVNRSTNSELQNNTLMTERIKKEIKKRNR